jgi:LysR family transcriptional regulator, nitrogen assimilation regulatory protein
VNLRQLEVFARVAEIGTLSEAALVLETVQPVLSRQIRSLEKELQVDLFHRTGRGLRLTDAGEKLLGRSKEILSTVRETRRELLGLTRSQLSNIVVAFSPTVSKAIARPFVRELFERHPDLKLRILEGVSGHIVEWMASRKVDVAVTYFTNALSRMNSEELCSEDLFLVSSQKKMNIPDTVSFSYLKGIPLVLPGQPHGLRSLMETMADSAGIELNVRIEADSFSTIKALVEEGVGCSTLPLSAITEDIRRGVFQISKITDPELRRHLVIITNSGRVAASGLNEVVKIIKDLGHLYLQVPEQFSRLESVRTVAV